MFYMYWNQKDKNFLVIQRPIKAVLSLETAAKKFLRSRSMKQLVDPFVKKLWSFEWKEPCQQILKNTYGSCNFGDILTYDKKCKSLFCTTHGKKCPVTKTAGGKRPMTEILHVFFPFQNGQMPSCWVKRFIPGSSPQASQGLKVNVSGSLTARLLMQIYYYDNCSQICSSQKDGLVLWCFPRKTTS